MHELFTSIQKQTIQPTRVIVRLDGDFSISETLQMFGFDKKYKYDTLKYKNNMLFYLGNSIVVNVLEELLKSL